MEGRLAELRGQASSSLKELKDAEARLRQEHSAKIALYETALKFLKEKADGGKLPALQTLKAEKEKLLTEKKERQEKYYSHRDQKKELDTVCANIHAALGLTNDRPAQKYEREER